MNIEYYEHRFFSDNDLLRARLFNKSRLAESGCWIWMGSKDAGGYGMLQRKKTVRAHRLAYEAFVGEVPKGMVVRHSCDNPCCINPGHLSLGTQKENMADRDSRGRRDVRGEQIGTSKLTAEQVAAIKSSELSGVALGAMFGVSTSTISLIRTGKSWKHLETTHGR